MKWLVNELVKPYLKLRMRRIENYMQEPEEAQDRWLRTLVETARNTEFGKQYGFSDIRTFEDYARMVPVHDYDALKDRIGPHDARCTGCVVARRSQLVQQKQRYHQRQEQVYPCA